MNNATLTRSYISLRQKYNDLRLVSRKDVDPSGFTLLAILKNEIYFLPEFLNHYRRLGVQRFVFLDDRSDDGSFEYLLEQPDTLVVHSDLDYGRKVELPLSISGPDPRIEYIWRSILHDMFALDRWALQVDLDEFIHLPRGMTFPELTARLDHHRRRALWGVMLDFYPKDIATLTESENFTRLDISAAWYFDGEQHLKLRHNGRSPKMVYPGARARLYCEYGLDKLYPAFGVRRQDRRLRLLRKIGMYTKPLHYNNIRKPVLLKWGGGCYFKNSHSTNLPGSMHYLLPIQHFRFSGSLGQRIRMALQNNSHFLCSSDYRLMKKLLCAMTEKSGSFLYRKSRLFESFDDFLETRNAVGF